MQYRVTIKRKAEKQIAHIAPAMQPRIVAGIHALSDSATWGDVRALVNHKYGYRLRVGDYRVLFDISNGQLAIGDISVEEVKKRDDRTY